MTRIVPAEIVSQCAPRLARVRPLVTVDADGTGRVEVRPDVERTAAGAHRPLTVRARVGGAEATAALPGTAGAVELALARPELWWPHGYGGQPLYALEVTLHDGTSAAAPPLDSWTRRVGFRTVHLDTGADAHGSRFTLIVNGEPLFARGVNWIPDDALPARLTPARYRERLRQAADAGVDLVRVWGGGIYESDDFYAACDELGLLVWQDFPFACAAYPEDQPLRGEVEAEARDNVVRLMPHPSLVLWCGNNENLWGFRDWGWEEELAGDSWGEGYYLGVLPRVVAELDPTRPYWAGSPWSGSWAHHPNDPAHGNHHDWEVWNRADYTDYRAAVPRFVAEFGWQAPPAWATLRRALGEGPQLAAASPAMLHHQKANHGPAISAAAAHRTGWRPALLRRTTSRTGGRPGQIPPRVCGEAVSRLRRMGRGPSPTRRCGPVPPGATMGRCPPCSTTTPPRRPVGCSSSSFCCAACRTSSPGWSRTRCAPSACRVRPCARRTAAGRAGCAPAAAGPRAPRGTGTSPRCSGPPSRWCGRRTATRRWTCTSGGCRSGRTCGSRRPAGWAAWR